MLEWTLSSSSGSTILKNTVSLITQLQPWTFTASDGITLRGWQTPLSGKPIIYFRHANGFSSLCYEPMLEVLAKPFDLIMMDAQGHGDSEKGGPISWQNCAIQGLEHIESSYPDWCQQAGSNSIPLYGVGHSFGAIMTLLTTGHRPQLFERTVLLDPVLSSPLLRTVNSLANLLGQSHRNPLVKQTLKRRSSWPSRDDAYKALLGRGIYKDWDDRAMHAFINHALTEDEQEARLKCDPITEATLFTGRTGPLWPSVKRVIKPMTIVSGEHTYPFVKSSARKAAKRFAPIEHISVPGGHCFMQEHPEQTAELIIRLLTQP